MKLAIGLKSKAQEMKEDRPTQWMQPIADKSGSG